MCFPKANSPVSLEQGQDVGNMSHCVNILGSWSVRGREPVWLPRERTEEHPAPEKIRKVDSLNVRKIFPSRGLRKPSFYLIVSPSLIWGEKRFKNLLLEPQSPYVQPDAVFDKAASQYQPDHQPFPPHLSPSRHSLLTVPAQKGALHPPCPSEAGKMNQDQ